MSLRELGVFNPLRPEHPLVVDRGSCWKCGTTFAAGMRVALNAIETSDQTGSRTVEAKAVCATCHLRGKEVQTHLGRRIVDRVKDGDASPYPVITTDGHEWRDDEVREQGGAS